jgi:predicted nucleic acid-binding Zn ribbon protein
MTPSRDEPKPLGEVLGAFLEKSGLQEHVGRQQVLDGWPDVVGDAVARVTRPRAVDGRTLVVEVRSSPWLMELNLMRGRILAQVNEAHPGADIERVIFVLAENP